MKIYEKQDTIPNYTDTSQFKVELFSMVKNTNIQYSSRDMPFSTIIVWTLFEFRCINSM